MVTPDGGRVVSASDDRTLKVWGLDTGRELLTLEGHAAGASSTVRLPLAISIDSSGRRTVSASSPRFTRKPARPPSCRFRCFGSSVEIALEVHLQITTDSNDQD